MGRTQSGKLAKHLRAQATSSKNHRRYAAEPLEDRRLLSSVVLTHAPVASTPSLSSNVTASLSSEPTIAAIPNATISLGSTFTYHVTATGNPAPNLSLYSPPTGMTLSASTAVITWTPTASQLGARTIRVQAANTVDTTSRSFTLTVTSPPAITTPAGLTVTAGAAAFSYQLAATGYPAPAFTLTSGAAGMAVSATGLLTWSAANATPGSVQNVTVTASSPGGSTTSSFSITVVPDTTPPTAPVLSVGPITSTSAIPLSWTASSDDVGVAGYRVFSYTPAVYRGHSGRGGGYTLVSPAKYTLLADVGPATAYIVSGLKPDSTSQFAVAAYDAAGNQSAYSSVVSGTTLLAPAFTWSLYGPDTDPAMSVVANHALSFMLYTSGNPSPALSLVSAPAGVVFTPGQVTNSQLTYVTPNISWTPTPDELGTQYITMQATNPVGSFTYAIPVTATPDTPQISLSINGGITYGSQQYAAGQSNYVVNVNSAYGDASQPQYGMVGVPFNFQVSSSTNTNPVLYTLSSAPAGMTLDPNTGAGTWTPTADQAGNTSVQIMAINDAGMSTMELNLPTYSSSAPATPTATYYVDTSGMMTPNPTMTWLPAADSSNVADYVVNVTTANGSITTSFDTQSNATSYALSGLANQQYFVTVTPLDANGNPGLTSGAVSIYEAGLPNVTWTVGQQNAIVGQPASVQFGSPNGGLGLTYSLVSAPAGATIDPNTGLVTWTPAAAGNAPIVVAVNAQPAYNWGTVVATVNVPVYFADAPTALALQPGADGVTPALATWSPPALNASAVTDYLVQIVSPSNGGTPIILDAPVSGPLSVSLSDMGITTGSIQVTALDAFGDVSLATPWVSF